MFFDFFVFGGGSAFQNPPLRTPGLRLTQRRGGKKEEKIDLFPLS